MTGYVPKVGDRVRVVLEGEVYSVDSSSAAFWLRDKDGCLAQATAPLVVSVEKVSQPLPTTPGSVVRLRDGGIAAKHADEGRWQYLKGSLGFDFQHVIEQDFVEVIFDAGAVS